MAITGNSGREDMDGAELVSAPQSGEKRTDEPLTLRALGTKQGAGCSSLKAEEARSLLQKTGHMVWIDVRYREVEAARALLQDEMGFHHLAVEDALSPNERPTLQEFDESLFLVVPALVRSQGSWCFVEVAFFLFSNSLVTVSNGMVPHIDTLFDHWARGAKVPEGKVIYIVHSIIDGVVDDYFPAIDEIEDTIDTLTSSAMRGEATRVREFLRLKRRMVDLRRNLSPMRDVVNSLLRRDAGWLPTEARRLFQDVLDHTLRLGELVDTNRDTLASLMDIHLTTVSNNLNEVMKKMTVVATVLMSMALISGIYGMNFVHMPELHWRYGYPFALGLMFAVGGIILLAFKKFNWL